MSRKKFSQKKILVVAPSLIEFFLKVLKVKKQPPEVFYKERCFPVNLVKFLRTPLLQNTFERPLLKVKYSRNFEKNILRANHISFISESIWKAIMKRFTLKNEEMIKSLNQA